MNNWKITAAWIVSGTSSITAGAATFLKCGDITAYVNVIP